MIDLKRWCGEEGDTRIGRPWSTGDFTCATNGHVLIRVPRRDDVEENEDAPDLSRGGIPAAFNSEPAEWLKVPAVTVKPLFCTQCGGTGTAALCPECEGEGEVLLDNAYNEYEVTCKTCAGDGQYRGRRLSSDKPVRCLKCDGTGEVWNDSSVEINGVQLSDRYLSWIGKLPNAEIGVFGPLDVARFRFDGGDGIIMPRQ